MFAHGPRIHLLGGILAILGCCSFLRADVPRLIHYQGKLRDAGGAAYDGTVAVRFRMYDAPAVGTVRFDELHASVSIQQGIFSAWIGSETSGGVPDSALDAAEVFLGVTIGGGAELAPRTQIVSTAHALKAKSSEQLVVPGSFVPAAIVDGAGNVGVGTVSPAARLDVAGTVRIADGSEGADKVLTSDAAGLASWQTPAAGGQWSDAGPHIYADNASDVVVSDAGNVGVGTTDVTAKLTVVNVSEAQAALLIQQQMSTSSTQLVAAYGTGEAESAKIDIAADGGILIGGSVGDWNAGTIDCLAIKLDAAGAVQWARRIGGGANDGANGMTATPDGGCFLSGWTRSFGPNGGLAANVMVMKIDSGGNLTWARMLGTSGGDNGMSTILAADGNYVVGGVTAPSYGDPYNSLLIKFDSTGAILWSTATGTGASEWTNNVAQAADGGFVTVGDMSAPPGGGSNDLLVIKCDASGQYQWAGTLGGAGDETGNAIAATADGGYLVAGYTTSFGAAGLDAIVAKLDGSGGVVWTRTLGGAGDQNGTAVAEASDGGLLVAGNAASIGFSGNDAFLLRFDASGSLTWAKAYGGGGSDLAQSLRTLPGGDILIGGVTSSFGAGGDDVFVIRAGSGGALTGCARVTAISPTITIPTGVVTGSPSYGSGSPGLSQETPGLSSNVFGAAADLECSDAQPGPPELGDALVVAADGNVGIGLDNPAYKLHVAGDIYATGSITQNSSVRWKRNVTPLTDALDKIDKLQAVYYDWDPQHGGRHDLGFIAEEAGKVLPEAVAWESDGAFARGLKYDKLTVLAIEGIKELREEVAVLRAENAALRARLDAMGKH